jgi:hypothetical protein
MLVLEELVIIDSYPGLVLADGTLEMRLQSGLHSRNSLLLDKKTADLHTSENMDRKRP